MSVILAENKLHTEFFRSTSQPTIAYSPSTFNADHLVNNLFDNNSATVFRVNSDLAVIITLPANITLNAVFFYGHSMRTDRGIKISTSTDGSAYTVFTDSAVYPANGENFPIDNNGKCFGVYLAGESRTAKYIKIETIGWDSETFLSNMAVGDVVSDVRIRAPYRPPLFASQKGEIKRNKLGNPLPTDFRKVPTRLNISLDLYTEAQLDATTTSTTINGLTKSYSFIDNLGFFLSRHPFYVMHDDGASASSNSAKKIARNKIYFCVADGDIGAPVFSDPINLSWNLKALGYVA